MTLEEFEELEILPIIVKSENSNGKFSNKVISGTYIFYKESKHLVKSKNIEEGLMFLEEDVSGTYSYTGVKQGKNKTIRFENAYNQGYISTEEAKKLLYTKYQN